MRSENQRDKMTENDRRSDPGGRGRKSTRKRPEKSLFCPSDCSVAQKIPEPADRNGCPRPGKVYEILIQPHGLQGNPGKKKLNQYFSRRNFGIVDEKLSDHADQSPDGKGFQIHEKHL